ncbi:hypothetical protein KTR66_03305 [Roseococcus sp. SDR]|uniref:hypothetical protein n=1 Tax=Roseococcus sp. SDR TaxID=2835532 RepID=UPI001BD14380|nr:hypothetical protein [Roseococcus sp. SDR]MBS7789005.1 hypothetical protein [Roseococcus sp. SDR]MBV1844319.1 hypothetical protein [Roseococcus sp. SDR]
MDRRMRLFGIWGTAIGSVGVIIFGLLLMQVMDDPKARTAGLKWGFILMALLGGMGVFVLSMVMTKRKLERRD